MASSGRKGKKNKGTVISLQSFLSNGDAPCGTTQVSKKVRNLDGDESDDGGKSLPVVYQLPTAPRANRIFDDESIPHKPPFIAYVNNLPFDANEEDIIDFFGNTNLVSLRLPREDGETGRSRGFGYVELESREDLINVLSLPDPSIKGRRIRIEMSNENEQQNNRQRGNRRFEGFGNNGENRDSGNWRRDSQNNSSGSSNNYDRGFNRDKDRKLITEDNSTPGSWRISNRSVSDSSPPRRDQGSERIRDNRNKISDREDRNKQEESLMERPKLNLKPRTLPLPVNIGTTTIPEEQEASVVKKNAVSAEKVFGSAKPVDTAARELEIEERLAEARRKDKIRQEQAKEEVIENLAEIKIEKLDKENANSLTNWRHRNDVPVSKNEGRRLSPVKNEDEHLGKKDVVDLNRTNKSRERTDYQKNKNSQNKDVKNKDEKKRDTRSERPLPKYIPSSTEPILQTSNKYSGLDDDASD